MTTGTLLLSSALCVTACAGIYFYQKLISIRAKLEHYTMLSEAMDTLRAKNLALEKIKSTIEHHNSMLVLEQSSHMAQINSLQMTRESLQERVIQLEAKIPNLELQCQHYQQALAQLKDNLRLISHETIKQNREEVMKESKQNINSLLEPLKTEIKAFKEKIEHTHMEDLKDRASLHTEIKHMMTASSNIGNQAAELADALKSKPKIQGNWGEIILENLLRESGLEKGVSYISQGIGLQLYGQDDALQQPDIMLKLPNNQFLIVDAKASLFHYQKYFNEDNETEKEGYLSSFARDIKNHIDRLHSKDYGAIKSHKTTLEIIGSVLMFIPVEGAYYNTLQYDKGSLHEYAWKRNITIVGPYNLMPILRIAASLCHIEQQNQNSQAITKAAGDMYDKFVSLLEEIVKIEYGLHRMCTSFVDLKKKINGHGGLIGRAQKMKQLGLKTTKLIPNSITEMPSANIADSENLPKEAA